jgi:hypothetical protein
MKNLLRSSKILNFPNSWCRSLKFLTSLGRHRKKINRLRKTAVKSQTKTKIIKKELSKDQEISSVIQFQRKQIRVPEGTSPETVIKGKIIPDPQQ